MAHIYSLTKITLMWSLHEIIHIWTAVVDESEEWSLQLIFQFKQLERWSLKKSGLQRDSNPWPPRYRCDARGGHGFESRWISPDFFRLHLSNCLNWKINCDDHSSLSKITSSLKGKQRRVAEDLWSEHIRRSFLLFSHPPKKNPIAG